MPTNAEIIFWVFALVAVIVVLTRLICGTSNSMEITWGQRRDWARREGEWRK